MPSVLEANDQLISANELLKQGVGLLSQQLWCWGCDILREEGNWLIEIGFERIEAPADREKCSSVYSLELLSGRRVVLRGFGVFYGDDRFGGIFLPRYEFRPRYTTGSALDCPPWSDTDLPKLDTPEESQRDSCLSLTVGLTDWIQSYELAVAERQGTDESPTKTCCMHSNDIQSRCLRRLERTLLNSPSLRS